MSSTRYIELVSSRRNRNEFPLSSFFEVPLSGSNLCYDLRYAVDPVSEYAPVYIFTLNSAFPPEMQTISDPASYMFNFGDNPSNSTIQMDPSDLFTGPDFNLTTGSITNNLYRAYNTINGTRGYLLYDNDVNATRKIIQQEANTIYSTFDVPMPVTIAITDRYNLIDGSAQTLGTNFTYDETLFVNPQAYDIFGRTIPEASDLFTNLYLSRQPGAFRTVATPGAPTVQENTPISSIITSHNIERRYLQTQTALGIDNPSEYYQTFTVRRAKTPLNFTGKVNNTSVTLGTIGYFTIPGANTSTITVSGLSSASASTAAGYKGQYIYISPYVSDPITFVDYPSINNEIKSAYFYKISDANYSAGNVVFTLDRPLIVSNYSNPTGATETTRVVEILPVTSDNFVPLNYTGSIVSQNEAVCYEIELTSLILPNVVLKTGSRIAFYSYVQVSLENISSAEGGTKNVFYSNNPASTKALFVAPVTDLNNPLTTPFVRLDGFGIIQTIKFKPNDALRFRVFLPDGSPFEPVEADNFSPQSPNPLLQISAVFAVKRL